VALVSAGQGRGSEFVVRLPGLPQAARVLDGPTGLALLAPPPVLPALHVRRILLIDDNADINQSLSDLLAAFGHVVDCAPDGETGLHMASHHVYDVICCDIGMPGMDGYAVARHLKRRLSSARLIAISGYEHEAQQARARAAGFQHYLIKPVQCQALLDLIDLDDHRTT
jgi:CheY-like chemotaxis protein